MSNKKFLMQVFPYYLFIFLGICVLSLSNISAQTKNKLTTYYVALNGSDSNSGTKLNLPLAKTMNEWSDYSNKFFQPNISDIDVTNGTCKITFYVSGSANDYALIDDVCLFRY
jgi:hypothetical protein